MNFDFSPQQYEFRDAFRTYLDREYPLARHVAANMAPGLDSALWQGLADLGLFGMLVPEAFGGLGLGFVDAALVLEALGGALVPPVAHDTLLAADLLSRHGSEAQQARYLPALGSGELVVALAVAEPEASGGTANIATTLTASGTGFVLSGRKILVSHAGAAGLLFVSARSAADGRPALVAVEPAARGVVRREHVTLDPSGQMSELVFDNVALPAEALLGGAQSPVAAGRLFDAAATAATLQLVGICERLLGIAVEYARTRVQFGQPIGHFQAIKHRCADMAVTTDAARTAAYYAAWAVGEGADEVARATSIAKSYGGDAARYVCNEAIQVHGGIGFTWDLGLHYYLRRAKVLEYAWGDATFHRDRLLAETLRGLALRA